MIYELTYFVPVSALKIVCYSMIYYHLQHSLLNWIFKESSLSKYTAKAILFCSKHFPTTLLYSNLSILKLDDVIKIEFAKFTFKINNKMLSDAFNSYFTNLNYVHKHYTRQKYCNNYYQLYSLLLNFGEKLLMISV